MAHKTLAEMKANLMQSDEFRLAYEAELRKERLQELLAEWRRHAGLNSADVAARMGIAPSTLSRMEKNITSASFENLSKYARACGVEMATLFFK
ncbi:MAG: helix-turn-helix transcriptional regulator [Pantoea sp.]|jgi:DNA-binding XRE family transcriptional regulator|uniref:helix-turn-helix domain-containing protein n=1 Tax=Pantoea TaxID=53335 RepID=UPI00065FFE5E|nr:MULTISPECIES: helix-turn-helix transcriptional regulator [Pantoea]MBS6435433.1 helix-turn-helix transcriptional regulator [Pantoea sp.]MDU1572276.1 helix-turn-helix transcriptional regulator [Pantoea sp.]MDU2727538.1 helix-turn-helix transcriptional regulator [Pantoea sp.]MDU5473464.1 helix-turn-helix transcriptional regulator [Pantoea sp.]MDU7840916.1 helix-turn-helix transcriptional regulator [Pantoea sp.]